MLYRAIGNVLHYLPAPPRGPYVLKRLRTRIEPPRPRPEPVKRWRVDPPELVERQAEPFIDVCSAMRIWNNQWMGDWRTFDLRKLAKRLGKKPWYRPLVNPR